MAAYGLGQGLAALAGGLLQGRYARRQQDETLAREQEALQYQRALQAQARLDDLAQQDWSRQFQTQGRQETLARQTRLDLLEDQDRGLQATARARTETQRQALLAEYRRRFPQVTFGDDDTVETMQARLGLEDAGQAAALEDLTFRGLLDQYGTDGTPGLPARPRAADAVRLLDPALGERAQMMPAARGAFGMPQQPLDLLPAVAATPPAVDWGQVPLDVMPKALQLQAVQDATDKRPALLDPKAKAAPGLVPARYLVLDDQGRPTTWEDLDPQTGQPRLISPAELKQGQDFLKSRGVSARDLLSSNLWQNPLGEATVDLRNSQAALNVTKGANVAADTDLKRVQKDISPLVAAARIRSLDAAATRAIAARQNSGNSMGAQLLRAQLTVVRGKQQAMNAAMDRLTRAEAARAKNPLLDVSGPLQEAAQAKDALVQEEGVLQSMMDTPGGLANLGAGGLTVNVANGGSGLLGPAPGAAGGKGGAGRAQDGTSFLLDGMAKAGSTFEALMLPNGQTLQQAVDGFVLRGPDGSNGYDGNDVAPKVRGVLKRAKAAYVAGEVSKNDLGRWVATELSKLTFVKRKANQRA